MTLLLYLMLLIALNKFTLGWIALGIAVWLGHLAWYSRDGYDVSIGSFHMDNKDDEE